jgi:hypothetical protein
MNPDIALWSTLALFALWIAVYYLWRDYRNDSFREHVFSIRDRMFLYAAQGNISFDNPAYKILRDRMNGLLRHGHEFTLSRMALILAAHPMEKPDVLLRWEAAVGELPQATQVKMKEFNVCVAVAVLQHVVYCSFFRYMTLRPLMFLFHLRKLRLREIVESPKLASGVERLENESLERDARLRAKTEAAELQPV